MRPWIDTHLHLLYPQRLHYDWTEAVPTLRQPFPLETYAAQAAALGIAAALHMEVDVRTEEIETETELVRELAARPGGLVRGAICACRPEAERSAVSEFAERTLADPFIHGFRRVLHTQPDDLAGSARFRDNVRTLTSSGHPFELCVLPRQIPLVMRLADMLPDSRFVLDHCGIPPVGASISAEWASAVRDIARRENVHCKLSGIIAYGDASRWPGEDIGAVTRDLRPIFEVILAAFGWSRLVWGSDYPVCTLTKGLTVWKAVTDELIRSASPREADALAFLNAQRIYRLDPLGQV
jgi:predicted TIM-barrel fold metal-dependent hydrolase